MRRAQASSATARPVASAFRRTSAGLQMKSFCRLGELVACVALNGPSIRIVPTCGKNV